MYKCKWAIIGKGNSGWHAKARSVRVSENSTCASSSSSHDPRDEQLNEYVSEAEENALVYDASQANESAFIKLVVSGPIVNPDLPAGHILQGLEKDSKPYENQKLGGFDWVSVDIYENLLRNVGGVRIGRVINQQVVWS